MNRAKVWSKFYKLNNYYHKNVEQMVNFLIPTDVSVIEFSSKGGEILKSLKNKKKIGVEFSDELVSKSKKIFDFSNKQLFIKRKYDYVLLSHTLAEIENVQDFLKIIKKISHDDTKIVVFYFNYFWKPFLDIAEKLGFKLPQSEPNWLTKQDVDNFFYLEDFDEVKSGKKFIIPYNIPIISDFINKYISPLPIINSLCMIQYSVYKVCPKRKEYSVSVIIPARNESGHMKGVLKKIPKMGKSTEVIFVEGNSTDDTFDVIKTEIQKYKGPLAASLHKQKGKGKGDAVRLGFSKAKNEILMILDADLTVEPRELPKFYEVIANGKSEYVMGSRLIYPMEAQAMRFLNILGNHFFGKAFSFLLGQRITDTLCGTKVLTKKNYEKISQNRKYFGDFDPFGDFDLIFGAAKLNMKIMEIPIRYKERVYGTTNISRFSHGWLLLQMTAFAARKIKFI